MVRRHKGQSGRNLAIVHTQLVVNAASMHSGVDTASAHGLAHEDLDTRIVAPNHGWASKVLEVR